MLKLRRLQLFDRQPVFLKSFDSIDAPGQTSNSPQHNQQLNEEINPLIPINLDKDKICCYCGSDYTAWFADLNGNISWFGKDFILRSFLLSKFSPIFMEYDLCRETLILIGKNEDSKGKLCCYLFSVSFNNPCKSIIENIILAKELLLLTDKKFGDQPPCCFGFHSEASYQFFAFGSSSGCLNIFQVSISKFDPKLVVNRELGSKVLGIYFLRFRDEILLFICTTSFISSYTIYDNGEIKNNFFEELYEKTDYYHCLNKSSKNLLVLRTGAVFTFHPYEGNLSAIPCDGLCTTLVSHENYFLTVLKESSSSTDSYFTPSQRRESLNICLSYPEIRLLAFSDFFKEVKCVISAMGNLFVFYTSSSGSLDTTLIEQLCERPVSERMEILIKKRLFEWATSIAINEGQPPSIVQEVHHLHADWLFKKRNFDQALSTYIKTIGYLEPSIVIEKYVSSQRIKDLSEYLLHLHSSGIATKDHTIMLFKCYTILRESPSIEQFITTQKFQTYDFRSVIIECRNSGYPQLALNMSRIQGQHDLFITILIEDFFDLDQAMSYLRALSAPVSCTLLMKFGRTLIQHQPDSAIPLLYEIIDNNNIGMEVFLPLFLDFDKLLYRFLTRYLYPQEDTSNVFVYSPLSTRSAAILTYLEILLRNFESIKTRKSISAKPSEIQIQPSLSLLPVTEGKDENLILSIIKLYLTRDEDFNSALKLCMMYSFKAGILYCCEKLSEFQIPLLYYIKLGHEEELNLYCNQNSSINPLLWTESLTYTTTLRNPQPQLIKVLENMRGGFLLPTLSVLKILESYNHVSVGSVKDYVNQSFSQNEGRLKLEKQTLHSLCQDLHFINRDKMGLRNKIKSFISNTCAYCQLSLDLPSINFYCGHSYHSYCINSEPTCPKCEPIISSRKLMYEQRKFQGENTEEFLKQVKNSTNSLEYIFNHFGRGMFK